MHCTKDITSDLIWLGGSDRRLALFENVYPIPRGVSYNAYLLRDEKTALLDTVDSAIADRFFENLEYALQGRELNYVIVNHMEPDHAATLGAALGRHPEAVVIGNAKTLGMIRQFFPMELEGRFQTVREGDTLSLGKHELTFVMAPLVHWPEVMMTYDTTDKILFSADAFGTFGAINGNIFADEVDFERDWLDDARRYYTNIVGKYGTPVQNVLKKAAGLDIHYLCPLHGPIWRENIGWFIEKYQRWSSYTPEEQAVYVETCPQYLLLDDSVYYNPDYSQAARYVCAPPIRSKENQEALWRGLRRGEIQTVSTDHCSFTLEQKEMGREDFTKIPGGLPGVETRGELIYSYGIAAKKLSLSQMCRVLCENPAKLYGLYPRKGILAPGSDGDIVVYDPGDSHVIRGEDCISKAGYTPYEGFVTAGGIRSVWLRGRKVVEHGTVLEDAPTGMYLSRGKYSL